MNDRAHTSQHELPRPRATLKTIAKMAADGEPFACLTAYDYTTARWLDRAGVPLLLVGDSAANVILGEPSTVHATVDLLVTLTAAVRRGAPGAVVMGDMPFLSYHGSIDHALHNAGRFMTDGRADIVKIEADASFAETVRAMTRAGIPVCAHVGTRPQTWALTAGPRISGRTEAEADAIVRDAVELERAGAAMLLIEAVPHEVTARVLEATAAPLIGIAAGDACHGQILVVQDLLGMSEQPPGFLEPLADLGPRTQAAAEEWIRRVTRRETGTKRYTMKDQAAQAQPAKDHTTAARSQS